jgi:hypothetical protein
MFVSDELGISLRSGEGNGRREWAKGMRCTNGCVVKNSKIVNFVYFMTRVRNMTVRVENCFQVFTCYMA